MQRYRFVAVLAIAGLMTACTSSSSSPPPAAGGDITATLEEWKITLSSSTASAGEVTFNITNDGEETHEFVVVSTDLADDALPVTDDKVDESAFTPVDEVEDIESGATPSLTVTLPAGHYVILCNLLAHYGKGMYAEVTVN